MDDKTRQLLGHLHRGGDFAYLWTRNSEKDENQTYWYPVGQFPESPPNGRGTDTYFGVHPTREQSDSYHRATIDSISVVNALYSEFDFKDFNSPDACSNYVNGIDPQPSVLIRSGGGLHAYWLLDEPIRLDNEKDRLGIAGIQRTWTELVGSDPGARTWPACFDYPEL